MWDVKARTAHRSINEELFYLNYVGCKGASAKDDKEA